MSWNTNQIKYVSCTNWLPDQRADIFQLNNSYIFVDAIIAVVVVGNKPVAETTVGF